MILLIDIGNSNICFGLHDSKTLINTYRIKSMADKSADEYYIIFNIIYICIYVFKKNCKKVENFL